MPRRCGPEPGSRATWQRLQDHLHAVAEGDGSQRAGSPGPALKSPLWLMSEPPAPPDFETRMTKGLASEALFCVALICCPGSVAHCA
jgi:hypothetical protein